MGVDLKLFFIDVRPNTIKGDRVYVRNILSCERQCELFDAIMAMGPRPIRDWDVILYYDGIKPLLECGYGNPITFLKVWELKNAFQHIGSNELYKDNLNICTYLYQLDQEKPVALYWH